MHYLSNISHIRYKSIAVTGHKMRHWIRVVSSENSENLLIIYANQLFPSPTLRSDAVNNKQLISPDLYTLTLCIIFRKK